MCLIVDANRGAEFLGADTVIIRWLLGEKGNPRLVASGKLRGELFHVARVRRLLVELSRQGRLPCVNEVRLHETEKKLRRRKEVTSNDHHVIALAQVSGARTLATEDVKLMADFHNPQLIRGPRGSIFRDPKRHAKLLKHTPKSCGVSDREK